MINHQLPPPQYKGTLNSYCATLCVRVYISHVSLSLRICHNVCILMLSYSLNLLNLRFRNWSFALERIFVCIRKNLKSNLK